MLRPVMELGPGFGTVFLRLPPCGVSHPVGWRFPGLSTGCVSALFLGIARS